MTSLHLAVLSLVRHRFSTLISVLAIGMAVACSGVLLRLYRISEARFSVLGRGGDAIIGAKGDGIEILLGCLNAEGDYPGFLPHQLFQSLKSRQTVQHADGALTTPFEIQSIIPFVYFGKYEKFRVVGTDESFLRRPRREDALRLTEGGWSRSTGQIVLGSAVARSGNIKVGDRIDVDPWIGRETISAGIPMEVTGILHPTRSTWDRLLYSTVAQAHEVFSTHLDSLSDRSIWGSDVLHYFLVYLSPGDFSALESLVNRRTVGQFIRVEEQKERLKEVTGVGKKLGLFVTVVVIFLGGLSVCSMLVTRFEGMSLQLAVLRALGYTRKEISRWLIWEGFLLGVLGVFAGMLMDFLALPLLRGYLGGALPPPDLVKSSVLDSWIIWQVALLSTVASVFVPVIRLSRQDAHRLLKGL